MNATTLGLNPYERMANLDGAESPGPGPVDRRSEGLNGETLDALLRGRWAAGNRLGIQEGHERAAAAYKDVYNEGFMLGVDRGEQERTKLILGVVVEPIETVMSEFEEISKHTSSEAIEDACARSLATLKAMSGSLRDAIAVFDPQG